jgi:hypothetical protein
VVIPDSISIINCFTFFGCSNLEEVVIPNNVKHIFLYAFASCTSLNTFSIPQSVEHIESYAFHNTAFFNNKDNWTDNVLYKDGCLLSADTLLSGEYSIPKTTRLIVANAFENCKKLTAITIPDSITTIEGCTFDNCSNLTTVVIGSNVADIKEYAFENCTNLTTIICLAKEPPTLITYPKDKYSKIIAPLLRDTFSENITATLLVPKGRLKKYRNSDWNKYFNGRIKEME